MIPLAVVHNVLTNAKLTEWNPLKVNAGQEKNH